MPNECVKAKPKPTDCCNPETGSEAAARKNCGGGKMLLFNCPPKSHIEIKPDLASVLLLLSLVRHGYFNVKFAFWISEYVASFFHRVINITYNRYKLIKK